MEGTEPTTFKANFESWDAWRLPSAQSAALQRHGSSMSELIGGNIAGRAASRSAEELAAEMAESPVALARNRQSTRAALLDDGGGSVTVWRIEDFAKVAVDEAAYGHFYAGDSYIVQYTYERSGKLYHTLYFWLGLGSSTDEKGAAALLTKQLDDELGGAATQVRVVMGKEPLHFLRCFAGRMVVHSGGRASGFRNRKDVDSYDVDGVSLFHVRGTDEFDTRAVQVEEKARALNSGDCFVLLTPPTMYVWRGEGSNEAEETIAAALGERMREGRALEHVAEGAEPPAFWEALGGKGEYPNAKALPEPSREPMLFCCSNATGGFRLEPVFDFGQADLDEDDVRGPCP